MANNTPKYLCLAFLLVLCIAPYVQQITNLFHSPALHGQVVPTPPAVFSISNWFEGTFQQNYEKNKQEQLGFRTDLVRLNNQWNYSLFDYACADNIVKGKATYLFQTGYINAYTGATVMSEKQMNEQLSTLQQLHDTLQAQGVHLIIALVPGKASFFPEYLPSYAKKFRENNHEMINRLSPHYHLDIIDMNSQFQKLKATAPYPLFPQMGIHWTDYGAYIGIDMLMKHIEQKYNVDLPNYQFSDTVALRDDNTDSDLREMLNIITKPKGYATQSVKITCDTTDQQRNDQKILFIGDSYFWNAARSNVIQCAFKEYNFWYYCHSIYPISATKPTTINTLDIYSAVKNYKYVVLFQTEAGYREMGYTFSYLYNKRISDSKVVRIKLTNYFEQHPQRMSMLMNEVTNPQHVIDSLTEYRFNQLAVIIQGMYGNAEWLTKLKESAANENMPLEDKMWNDAVWIFERENDITSHQ